MFVIFVIASTRLLVIFLIVSLTIVLVLKSSQVSPWWYSQRKALVRLCRMRSSDWLHDDTALKRNIVRWWQLVYWSWHMSKWSLCWFIACHLSIRTSVLQLNVRYGNRQMPIICHWWLHGWHSTDHERWKHTFYRSDVRCDYQHLDGQLLKHRKFSNIKNIPSFSN